MKVQPLPGALGSRDKRRLLFEVLRVLWKTEPIQSQRSMALCQSDHDCLLFERIEDVLVWTTDVGYRVLDGCGSHGYNVYS